MVSAAHRGDGLRHQANDPRRHLAELGTCGRARRRHRPRARSSPTTPTGCSCPTGRATRPRSNMPPTTIAALIGKVPIFGICLGHQLLVARHRRRHRQDAVRPPRRQPSGEEPGHRHHRDHQPEPQLRRRWPTRSAEHADDDPRQPQRRHVCQGHPPADAPAFSVQHHPEAGPGPTTAAYLFAEFEELMDHGSGGRCGGEA